MGCWRFPDGSCFEGRYIRGSRVKGRFTSADGQYQYDGECGPDGSREGYGVSVLSGMYEYRGDWKKDKRDGQGECRYSDGSVYK